MRILLLWRSSRGAGEDLDPERVARKLQQIFAPLFSTAPKSTIRQTPAMTMVFLQLPVRGWKPPFFEEDEQTWALAIDYPIDARTVLAANGISVGNGSTLPVLCRNLQGNPTQLLREMAPPFSVVWSSKQTGETFVQNDGLGSSQLLEYKGDKLWVLTNKIFALKALGVPLELEAEQWAIKSTLDWFPLNLTGYKRIHYLKPATQIHLDSHGMSRMAHDVLSEWVNPGELSQAECAELARSSLLKQIKAAMPLWENPTATLTGGWDTRAVVSVLRALGVEFSARVKGRPPHYDVVIASYLAKIAGFELRVSESVALPPAAVDDCRRSIKLALLWQAGFMMNRQHKEFRADGGLPEGHVKIMGQHGEIGRGTYARRIRAVELKEEQYEEHLVSYWMKNKMPTFTRNTHHDRIREIIREAYREADRYGLTGLRRLVFFSLHEAHRRWASAKLSLLPGLNFAPFLNPDYIRASFGYQGQGKQTNPFHRHIIATHGPDWAGIPYTKDPGMPGLLERIMGPPKEPAEETPPPLSWRQSTGTSHYDHMLYWKGVGAPIIREALDEGGFWTEVFDPELAEQQWQASPDILAVLHLLPLMIQSQSPF